MRFEEIYQDELDNIKPSYALNQKLINTDNLANKKVVKIKRSVNWKIAFTAVACIAIAMVGLNYNSVASFAKSILGTWGLSVGNEEIEFGDIKPIEFDFEKFKNDPETEFVANSADAYGQDFSGCEECKTKTGIDMVNAEEIEYAHISVVVAEPGNNIHISSSFDYKDFRFVLNGMATAKSIENDSWGYGTNEEAVEVYEYEEDEKAYFVNEGGVVVVVYFQTGNIMYQMFIDTRDEEWGIEIGKELIDILLK